jgi:hypothetical protein
MRSAPVPLEEVRNDSAVEPPLDRADIVKSPPEESMDRTPAMVAGSA